MICAACGQTTEQDPCSHCGAPPILEGRYRLLAVLGQGGVGTTYRAERLDDGAQVAVKEMPLRRAETAKARELMEREATVLRQLDHPDIPDHYESFFTGAGKHRSLVLVQEFIEGRSLADELDQRRYTEEETVAVLAELLPILTYLHSLRPPVIHRDLKPSNVMRRPDGSLVVIDFGAARDAVKDPDLGGSTIAGTFGYMAPEQFQGDASPATDLYALGVLAVSLLTREEPRAMLDSATFDEWLAAAHVSAPFRAYLRRLTARDLAERPVSAAVAGEQLLALTEPSVSVPVLPVSSSHLPPVPGPRPAKPPPPRATQEGTSHRFLFATAVVSLVCGLLLCLAPGELKEKAPAPAVPAEPTCGGEACRPLSEARLKGVQLGMTREEANGAFPGLVEATPAEPEAVAKWDGLYGGMPTVPGGQLLSFTVPGEHLTVQTTLLEQPAACTFVFAVDQRVSKMTCELTPQTKLSHLELRDTVLDMLTERYGRPDSTSASDPLVGMPMELYERSSTWDDGAGLSLQSKYSGMGSQALASSIVVSAHSLAHVEMLVRLEGQVRAQLAEEREAQRRQAEQEGEALRRRLEEQRDRGDGDL